ncbi:MAG: HAMP domain-containing sensor histidine kinase [bacterium]
MINLLSLLFTPDPYCLSQLQDTASYSLLFYSHIPTATIALIFGSFIISKNKSIESKIFFFLTFFFFLFSLCDLAEWLISILGRGIGIYARLIIEIIDPILFITSSYFLFVLIKKKDVRFIYKIFWSLPVITYAGILIFSLSKNLIIYNWQNCEVIENNLVSAYGFCMDFLYLISAIIFSIWSIIKSKDNRKEISFISFGICFFMIMFFVMEYVFTGYIFGGAFDYNWFIYSFFGMPILIGFLAFLIVRFHEFNIKAFGAQALIFALIALIGSQFFYANNTASVILTAVTLAVTGIIGINLMRSVKKEIDLREKIEKTEKDLETANSHLKELDVQKTEFISFATHQLRGPLTAVKGYASLLLEGDYGEMTDQVKEAIKVIYESTQSLLLIVGDYLNISRMEQGRMKYDLTEFDMKTLVEETVRELGPNLSYAGLTLTFENVKDPCLVSADRGKIKEVISNLIDNATKYTKKGGINIKLEKVNADRCRLMIKDTGIGIPAEVMPKLFEKFSRAPDASKTNIMGTGLGLYVAKTIIEQHKGRVWAESEGAGKGSTFIVELRLVSSDAHVPEAVKKFAEGL